MTSVSSHVQNAVPVELSPKPAFCIKSRVLPDGLKLFVNICHDSEIPIPQADGQLPVVLSDRREGTDKSGQPCTIFDAIFNPELCTNATKNAELRQASLIRIEQDTGYKLSRTIATPNIKSKGPIPTRTARIPAFWAGRASLVQEVDGPTTPIWTWSPTRDGCRIVINVPDMTKSLHETSTLDIEARRLIFTAGSRYHLDTPLLPAAGTKSTPDVKPVGGGKFLPTTVDPDSAVAEWSINNQDITIAIKWASAAAREREKEKM